MKKSQNNKTDIKVCNKLYALAKNTEVSTNFSNITRDSLKAEEVRRAIKNFLEKIDITEKEFNTEVFKLVLLSEKENVSISDQFSSTRTTHLSDTQIQLVEELQNTKGEIDRVIYNQAKIYINDNKILEATQEITEKNYNLICYFMADKLSLILMGKKIKIN